MSDARRPWLIAYDIRCPRRLTRLHQWLIRHATPLQYSVFLGRYDRAELADLRRQIEARIDPLADDVRLYPLPERPQLRALGVQRAPEAWWRALIDVSPP
jgi:CRISPR-associated protein Cas2